VRSAQDDFFTVRWRSIQQRFWGRSQWVLGIDGDIMAANLTRSLDAWLELPQDLVLTVRVRRRGRHQWSWPVPCSEDMSAIVSNHGRDVWDIRASQSLCDFR